VLLRLYKVGLQVDIKKLKFNVYYIKYLGFFISIKGIKVDLEKTVIIYN
jgi:hypothetical protein